MAIQLGSRLAVANNNPGNLRYVGQQGASQGEGGFARFETPEAGYEALKNQIKLDAGRGHTVSSFINKYAPPVENDTGTYVKQASSTLGVDPTANLASIDVNKVAKFMAQKESSTKVSSTFKVKFDTGQTVVFDRKPSPQDIEEVSQKLKLTPKNNVEQNGAPISQVQPTQPQEQKEGILPSLFRGITQPVATMLARPFQAGAMALGATTEDVNAASAQVPFYGEGGRLDIPTTGKDVLKDVGRAAQTVSLGMPVGSVGQAAKMGATAGFGAGLEQDPTNLGVIAANTAMGAGAGAVGGGISKGFAWLPKSLTKGAFPKATEQDISRLLTTKTAAPTKKLLEQNSKSLNDIWSQAGNIIKSVPDNKLYTAQDVLNNAVKDPVFGQQIQNMGIDLAQAKKLINQKTTNHGLVDKFFGRGLDLDQLHTLNSSLGKKIYNTTGNPLLTDANRFGDLLYGKTTELIQSTDKRLPGLFEEYGKERALTDLLKTATKKSGQQPLLTYNDIISALAGSSMGGPVGGLGGIVASKLMNRPSALFGGAKLLQGVNKATTPVLNRTGLLPGLIQGQSTNPNK